MPARKGLLAPQNTFLDTIATRFDGTHSNFVLGNAKITKIYPIVYCSDGFCDLSGYSRAQIMQKSCACNFLYGQKTDSHNREAISRALEQKKELKLEVILYKSSGTPFWCLLDIVPIQDEKHEVVLFLCSHKDITKQKLHEQQQHQLAQLHAQKQQQLLSNAAAAAAAAAASDHPPVGSPNSEHQQSDQHNNNNTNNSNRNHNLQQVVSDHDLLARSGRRVAGYGGVAEPDALMTDVGGGRKDSESQQQQLRSRKLEDADEAELTAMANQNALLSMDEFGLLDDSGGEGGDFDCDANSDSGDDHDKHTASQYSRRRSRAVLYQLSGHYGYRRSVNMKSKLKLNNRMNIPEYKTTTIEKQRFILSHYGVGKSCWDWLILVVSFYVAIVVPYNATFKDKQDDLMGGECKIDSIDILVELVFLIDVLLNFRTTFVNRKGEVVTRPEIICKHYVRGWFVVDACAALPFDLLCSLNLYSRSRLDLNLLKLIRLLRLARLLQKMDRYSQYSYIILTLLMLIFSLLAHWCACIWYVIAMEEIAQNPSDWKIGWLHQLSDKLGRNVVNATDMAASYVTALYFTTSSLTSVGFGNVSANTNAEKIFSIVIMLIGALMHAVVFGNVTALIRVMYARRSNYQTRLRDLKDFFRLHQLPKELQQRMSDYFQTTWSLNHGIETYEILKDFPEELRGDVSLHLHREVLSLPIFETAPQGFLKSLARHIESKFCCPTEYLIHRGDALNYLYLVCNGSMEVLQDNMVVAILGKGDLVGYDVNALSLTPEHAAQYGLGAGTGCGQSGIGGLKQPQTGGSLMTSKLVKSSSDLKALTYCDLKCVHIAGLLDVLKLYPEFSDTFHREIIHDLSFNLRENHDHDLEHDDIMMGGHDHIDSHDEEDLDDDEDEDNDGDDDDEDREVDGDDHDDGDNDDDEDHDQHGTGQRQQRLQKQKSNGKGSRSKMNQLFRSIEHQQSHQIGRYDYVDDDEDVRQGEDEELITDEQDEEDDDDENDDDDEDDEDEDEEREDVDDERDNENNDEDDGDNNGDSNHNSGATPTVSGRADETSEGANNSKKRPNNSEQNGRRNSSEGDHRNDKSKDDEEQLAAAETEVATNRLPENLRRRRMRAVDGSERGSKEGASDSVSWHSCDGLSGSLKSPTQLPDGNAGRRGLAKMSRRNNSHESAPNFNDNNNNNNNNSNRNGYRQQPVAGGRHKLRGAGGIRQQSATNNNGSGRKPPIMFDLSRNTTVIVDRRRRSAGCILAARPLLIGPAASTARLQTNYSSLTHISENPGCDSGDTSNHRTPRPHNIQRGVTGSDLTRTYSGGYGGGGGGKISGTYSNQDLKGLDTRINCLSTSVRELKRELQHELTQMRGTMQLFVRMVEQQQRLQPTGTESPGSLGQIPTSSLSSNDRPTRRAIPARGRRTLVADSSQPQLTTTANSGHTSAGGVHRSQSAASLPSVTSDSGGGSMLRLSAGRRRAGILREQSDLAECHSVASEPSAQVVTSISLDSSDQKSANTTMIDVAEAAVSITGGSSRAVSQCSQSTVSSPQPAPASCISQLHPSANSAAASNCLQHSDNDSGRSSSSMNSSSQQAANNIVAGRSPFQNQQQTSPYLDQDQNRTSGRLNTRVLFKGAEEGSRPASGKQYATITARNHDNNGHLGVSETTTATSSSKSSLV